MDDESDRAAILNRRAKLVAAALAGLLGASCGDDTGPGGTGGPQACLSPPYEGGQGGVGGPQPCLEPPIGGGGAGVGGAGEGGAGGAGGAGTGGTGGMPCLTPKK